MGRDGVRGFRRIVRYMFHVTALARGRRPPRVRSFDARGASAKETTIAPTGQRPSAQGCVERATLGERIQIPANPNGVASVRATEFNVPAVLTAVETEGFTGYN